MEPLSLDLRLGKFQVHLVQDGFYRLDGGAMFGVVPKVLWERRFPADEANRIRLGLNSLLIRTPEALVLVEAGIGGALDAKERDFLVLEQPHPLPERLARLGVSPAEVDLSEAHGRGRRAPWCPPFPTPVITCSARSWSSPSILRQGCAPPTRWR